MACTEHPNYGGKRSPRSECKGCWDFYNTNKESPPEEIKLDVVCAVPPKLKLSKEEIVQIVPEVCSPVVDIIVPEELKLKIEDAMQALYDDVYEKKITQLRTRIAAEMDIQYEHLFINDNDWHANMMKMLEAEGWEWLRHTYPLAKNGIVSEDYNFLKRIKKATNKPIPDFSDPKTVKRYGGIIKAENNNKKK
jgi:hypothetical protein